MKISSATYTDFVKFDKKPNEDWFLISQKYPVFAVADGVTQSHFADGTYAYPMGAKDSAQIFCQSSVEVLQKVFGDKPAVPSSIKKYFKEAFDVANKKVVELNKTWGIDKKFNYVEYDWFDAVGVAGIISGNTLHYGFVGDCGLVIFDKYNKKKFQTKDMVAPAVKKMERLHAGFKKFTSNERALIMHRDFRNRPDGKGYGSFSGEEGVQKYYAFGAKKLAKGDLVVFYSDGFSPYVKNKEFVKILRTDGKKVLDNFVMKMVALDPKVYGDDRTFVSVII